MKSKTTSIWFLLAAALLAFIWFQQKYLQPAPVTVARLLPGFHAGGVTSLQVSPAGKPEISATLTNGSWMLEKPLNYPAQAAAVEALAGALEKLTVATRLSAKDISRHPDADAEYGFDNPQYSLVIHSGDQRQQLIIGSRTAPGDQVFVRVVGLEGAFVVDASWLNLLPDSPAPWRDTALVDDIGACNWIVITNGTKSMEFRRDATNHLWRMIRPLQARANSARIASAFQQLRDGQVRQFVTDNPNADLSGYGLQPADMDVWLGRDTNFLTAVHAGKTLATNSAEVYVQREGWDSVMTADKDIFAPWRASVYDFRDPYLLSPLAPVAEIQVLGADPYTLQERGSNDWVVVGQKFPVDAEHVGEFVKLLAGLRISEFVKDVVTDTDLESFGLTKPSRQILLLGKAGDTNDVLAHLIFGTEETNRVFVKRADESFVYAIRPDDLMRLPEHSWEFRDRHIWHFAPADVVQITMNQNNKTRQLIRSGDGKWAFADNSQGIIRPRDIEETVQRLGGLTAYGWVGSNITNPKLYGLEPGNLALTVELKSGEKLHLDFGRELPSSQTALAAVTLDGERWVFVMDPVLYQFVATFLTIPPNAP
jgi:hypothetical protein